MSEDTPTFYDHWHFTTPALTHTHSPTETMVGDCLGWCLICVVLADDDAGDDGGGGTPAHSG